MTKPDLTNLTEQDSYKYAYPLQLWIEHITKEINEELSKKCDLQKYVGRWYYEYGEIERIFYKPIGCYPEQFQVSFWPKIDESIIKKCHLESNFVIIVVNNGKERREIHTQYNFDKEEISDYHEIRYEWNVI